MLHAGAAARAAVTLVGTDDAAGALRHELQMPQPGRD